MIERERRIKKERVMEREGKREERNREGGRGKRDPERKDEGER